MSSWSSENNSGYDQVGYAKVGGKWCIALSSVEEFIDGRDDDWDIWAFGDGPRRLRLEAIDHLPNLLEKLKDAVGETKKLTERTDDLQQLVAMLKEGVKK